MDNTRYKSVAVPNQVHDLLKRLAHKEGRTIGGQMSHIVRRYNSDAFGKHLESIRMEGTFDEEAYNATVREALKQYRDKENENG